MTYKILLPQEIMAEGREYLESRGYQLINGSGMEEEDIIRDIGDCDGIIVRLSKMSDRVFEAAKKLKVVARYGRSGVSETSRRSRIKCANCEQHVRCRTGHILYAALLA